MKNFAAGTIAENNEASDCLPYRGDFYKILGTWLADNVSCKCFKESMEIVDSISQLISKKIHILQLREGVADHGNYGEREYAIMKKINN